MRSWLETALLSAAVALAFPAFSGIAAPVVPAMMDKDFRPLPQDQVPAEVMVRARVTDVAPKAFVRICFGWPKAMEFARYKTVVNATTSGLDLAGETPAEDIGGLLEEEKPIAEIDAIEVPDKTYTVLCLRKGVWSPAIPLSLLGQFQTFTVRGMWPRAVKTGNGTQIVHDDVAVTRVTVEFELIYDGKPIKTFSESTTDGDKITVRFATHHLVDGDKKPVAPGPEFLDETCGLVEYARRRADAIEALPWAKGPLPKRYTFLSACSGWKTQTSNKDVYMNEYRTMRQLGCNGIFYGTWDGIDAAVRNKAGIAAEFGKARGDNQNLPGARSQYILPRFHREAADNPPGAGCPAHPANADHRERVRAGVEELMAGIRTLPYEECWFQTISEIGSYYDNSAEGKAHQGCCPHCRKAFQEFVRGFGLSYADFGASSWDDIRSLSGYFATPFDEQKKQADATKAAAEKKLQDDAEASSSLNAVDPDRIPAGADDPDNDIIDLPDEDAEAKERQATGGKTPAQQPKYPLPDHGVALLKHYSARFNNESSARIFAPLREALVEQNEKKRAAVAAGKLDAPEAKQPWVYSFALRGNSFLMGGHSLDFFDWYRHADNAFQYETSNRDPRVWEWESYLCDVGRIHQKKLGTVFSLMIKPDRGAVVQRTLTSVARGVRAIYWYTYGPDWHHPDTFASFYKFPILERMSHVVHMIGEAEDVIYDADWAFPAEVAVVRANYGENDAMWENGKWVYQALTHAHIPVDALDDGYLASEDLSRYKAIYVSESGMRRDAALKLARWVEAGGVLVTSAGGLAIDESGRPLEPLQAAGGLQSRAGVDLWGVVKRYGSTKLAGIDRLEDPPTGARVTGKPPFGGTFDLAVGREVLVPGPGTEVLATFADGGAAVTRHSQGKGAVYVVGFYPGMEYASDVLVEGYDMSRDFRDDKRGFIAAAALAAGVRPVVDASHPLVEGVLVKNPKTGKQAVLLMNWAYKGREHVPLKNVAVTIRGAGSATSATSLWNRVPATTSVVDGLLTVTLPLMEEGEILLLE